MAISDIQATIEGSNLNLVWPFCPSSIHCLSIQVSPSPEFIGLVRTFVIPPSKGASIDIGNGKWFFRIGAWYGTPETGIIEWSGIYGPAHITNPKMVVPVKPPVLQALHTQAIVKGLRIHTGITTPYYVVIDYSKNNEGLNAGVVKSQYTYDTGRGYFDITGLDSLHKYNARFHTFDKEYGLLPKDSIKQLCAYSIISQKRPARNLPQKDSSISTTRRSEDTLLKDMARKTSLHFSSHLDYIKYIAAKAKTSEELL